MQERHYPILARLASDSSLYRQHTLKLVELFHRIVPLLEFPLQERLFKELTDYVSVEVKMRMVKLLPPGIQPLHLIWSKFHGQCLDYAVTKCMEGQKTGKSIETMVQHIFCWILFAL